MKSSAGDQKMNLENSGLTVLFSVLTPSFNYGRFINEAIESVICFDQAEIVIQDGGSSDDTAQIAKAKQSGKVLFETKLDHGQSDALNKAFHRSRGAYIGWLNADDFYFQGTLKLVADYFDKNPKVDIVFGDVIFVDESGKFVRYLSGYSLLPKLLRYRGPVLQNTVTFYRRGVIINQEWDIRLRTLMDWDYSLSAHKKNPRYKYLPQALGAFRLHSAQITNVKLEKNSIEHQLVANKHGLIKMSSLRLAIGNIAHKFLKLFTGALFREYSGAAKFRNQSIEFKG